MDLRDGRENESDEAANRRLPRARFGKDASVGCAPPFGELEVVDDAEDVREDDTRAGGSLS